MKITLLIYQEKRTACWICSSRMICLKIVMRKFWKFWSACPVTVHNYSDGPDVLTKAGWLLFDSFINWTCWRSFRFPWETIQVQNELYDSLGTASVLTKDGDDDIMIRWQKCRITGPSATEPQTPEAPWHETADSAVVRTVITSKTSRICKWNVYTIR